MRRLRAAALGALAMSGSRLGEPFLLLELDALPGRVAEHDVEARGCGAVVDVGELEAPVEEPVLRRGAARAGRRGTRRGGLPSCRACRSAVVMACGASRRLGPYEGGGPGVGDACGPARTPWRLAGARRARACAGRWRCRRRWWRRALGVAARAPPWGPRRGAEERACPPRSSAFLRLRSRVMAGRRPRWACRRRRGCRRRSGR